MASELVSVAPTIKRDRYDRPLITPIGGGKDIPYSRCTTFIDAIESHYNLEAWAKRNVAIGLADDAVLMQRIKDTDPTDKAALNEIVKDAARHGEHIITDLKFGAFADELRALGYPINSAAEIGTAMHDLTEKADRGEKINVGGLVQRDVDAYVEATRELKHVHIEAFTVQDKMQVAGTPDRVSKYKANNYIADLKTGSIEYGTGKIAAQLSMYAHSNLYDIRTSERTHHNASPNRGIIIHLPAGTGVCALHWVDLEEGWRNVQVAKQIRERRKLTFKKLTAPFGKPEQISLNREKAEAKTAATKHDNERARLEKLILASDDVNIIRDLWTRHEDIWTDHLTETARAHIQKLPA